MPRRFVDSYLPYLLMQAANRMSLTFHTALKKLGVRESEWRVLATLSHSSGMRLSELERHVAILQSTLSRTISRLEAKGWVEARKDPVDGRALQLVLTPAGQVLADLLDGFALDENVGLPRPVCRANHSAFDHLGHFISPTQPRLSLCSFNLPGKFRGRWGCPPLKIRI